MVVNESPIVLGVSKWEDLDKVRIGCPVCDGEEEFLDARQPVRPGFCFGLVVHICCLTHRFTALHHWRARRPLDSCASL